LTFVVAVCASLLPPKGGNPFRSVAPPLRAKPTSLGFVPVFGTGRVRALHDSYFWFSELCRLHRSFNTNRSFYPRFPLLFFAACAAPSVALLLPSCFTLFSFQGANGRYTIPCPSESRGSPKGDWSPSARCVPSKLNNVSFPTRAVVTTFDGNRKRLT